MVNAKTRNQWKARLETTEALTSSARDGKGEAAVKKVPSLAVSKREKSWSRKRKLGEVLEEQASPASEIVAFRKEVQNCTRGKSSKVLDGSSGVELRFDHANGTVGRSDPRAPAHQRTRKRGVYGAVERTRDIGFDAPAENRISPGIVFKEAFVYHEEKKGKRKVSGQKVLKKVGDGVSSHGRELKPNRKRRNLLHGLGAVNEDIVNVAGPVTRGMVKPGTDGQTEAAHTKRRKRFRPAERAGEPIIAEGESADAEAPSLPGEEAAKVPTMDLPINGSNMESSKETAEFDRVLEMKATAALESPVDVSDLNHVPLQAESRLSRPDKPRQNGKSISEVHLVNESRNKLPILISPRVTRGMKGKRSDPAGITEGSPPVKGDPTSCSRIDEPAEPTIALETASMELRNHKKIGENLSADRPRKRVKKKQDKLSGANCQNVIDMRKANASILKVMTTNGSASHRIIDAATSDSQVNRTAPEGNGNSFLNRDDDSGGGAQLSSTEGVHTRGSKMDGLSGIQPLDRDLLPAVSGLSVQCIKGGVETRNGKGTSHTKECTEVDGRKGGRLGRMKKREKKKIDPGGGDSVQENKPSDPCVNVLRHEKMHQCEISKESPEPGPGPSNDSQPELGKQGMDAHTVEGMTSKIAGKSQKPVGPVEITDKTGVDKSVHLAETDGGCQQTDHHDLASKTLLDQGPNGKENKLDTVMPTEGPSKPAGVLTRGSQVGGRKASGAAKGSIQKKLKTNGNGGCQQIDHHDVAWNTFPDEGPNGEEKKLDNVAPGEGPSQPVGVLTRRSQVDGRKSSGPANGSIKKKFKTKGNLERWKSGGKTANSKVLLQNFKSHVENRGLDSAHEKAAQAIKNSLQGEHINQFTEVEVGTSPIVRPTSNVAEGNPRVVPEVGLYITATEFSSGQGIDSGLVESEGPGEQRSLLDEVAKVTPETRQVGLSTSEGNPPDQGEHCPCDREDQQMLPKDLPEPKYHITATEFCSGQGIDSGFVESEGSGEQRSLLDDVAQVTPETPQVGLSTSEGNSPDQGEHCLCDREDQQMLPKDLPEPKYCNTCLSKTVSSMNVTADGRTFKGTSEEDNLKDSAHEHEVTADSVQSEQCEDLGEPLNVDMDLTQNPVQVRAELVLQSSKAQRASDSAQDPVKQKKVWRRKDYGRGIEFQRITRARDGKGKSISDTEVQGSKAGIVEDAVIGKHVEVSAEGVVSTTGKSKDCPLLEETDAGKEVLEQEKSSVDVSELLVKSASASPKDDFAAATIEQVKEMVQVMDAEKSVVTEITQTDGFAVQEAENSEEPTRIPCSVLTELEESETAVQGELDVEQDVPPASSIVSLLYRQQSNIEVPELLSKPHDSPDGPLRDGTSLTMHCGQQKAWTLDGGALNSEVTHSPCLEIICVQDAGRFGPAHGAFSVSTLDKPESLTIVKTLDPVASVDKSDQVAIIVESDLTGTMVESSSVASSVESDPHATIGEVDPGAAIDESDLVATKDESDPVAPMTVSDPVPSTVDEDIVGTMVDSYPCLTVVKTDPVSPIASESSSVDIHSRITTEIVLYAIPSIGKPQCVATVTDSDSVTTAVNAISTATGENYFVPTNVVNKENTTKHLRLECMACEIGSVRECAGDCDGTRGESLSTEAANVQQEQVILEAFLEEFESRGDIPTKSPLLEREGFQPTLSGEVADSVKQGQPTPIEDSVRQSTSEVEDSLPQTRASSEPRTTEAEPATEQEPCTSHRGGPCVELVSSDCSQLDLTDQKCTKASSDVALDHIAADLTQQEGSIVPLLDQSLLTENAEPGLHLSVDGPQKSYCFSEDDLPVGTGLVVTRHSVNSIAADIEEGTSSSPASRSCLGAVTVDIEPLEQKLPSEVEDLLQGKLSVGQEPDEPILKNVEFVLEDRIEVRDETKEENVEVREVLIDACGVYTETTEAHSKPGKMPTHAVGIQSEANQVNLKAEELNVVVGDSGAQAEVYEVQVEAQLVDGAEGLDLISVNGHDEPVNADTDGKQLDTEAKELHVGANNLSLELDRRSEVKEVNEVNAQKEVDAESKDAVPDELTNENEHTKGRVLGLDSLVDTSVRQSPPSRNAIPCCDSSVPLVSEVDISRPRSSDCTLDPELMDSEPVTLNTEKHVEIDERSARTQLNQQVAVQSVQLTSPLEGSRCLEGDVVHPEELTDILMETHEKDYPKAQTLRFEEPASQKNIAGVKGPLVFKRRKGRNGIETTKEPEGGARAEDAPSRVYSKKKGFLLTSTPIESGGMRIRPRPLDPDQSIPIFVEGQDKDFHDYDGGSFYRWVQQQEEAKLKKPAVDPVADGVSEGSGLSSVSRTDLVKKRPIFIPLFRKLPEDKRTNVRIVMRPEQNVVSGMQSPCLRPQTYLRNTNSAARKLGHALGGSFCTVPSVYDMDDEDEEWLQAYNEILKHSGADQLLSEDTFEQLMELFEREFYRICQISDKSLPVFPRSLGEKDGASGRRGKTLVMDSSQRHSRLEANKDGARFSNAMEFSKGALSQMEIERRFALHNLSDDCCICNGGENSDLNPVRRCQICSINVHESCYGICATEGNEFGHHAESPNWRCRKCEAVLGGMALSSISCAICCKSGGAMKPTVDPLKWAHVACALYTNETFFIDTEAMEPVDGLVAVEARVKKQRERCGLCGAREGSCVRCSTRGCRTPFHISCGVSQGASFELRHSKQQVEGIRSFCPHHATFVPGTNIDEIHHVPSKADDAGELLPAVSTESSDTLEMRHVERINVGDEGDGTEDAIMNGVGWQGSFSKQIKVHQTYFRKFRNKARPGATNSERATPRKLDPKSSPDEISVKDVHGVSRTLPRSGSILKENSRGVSQYMDETDPYVHPSDAERLESEAVSAATSASSSHLTTFENLDHTGNATSNVDEGDPLVLAAKDKPVTRDAYISDAMSLKFPSLETFDTNLAPLPIVRAVYSFWQVKRVKSKGPILHELRQLQVARSQGIFNKIVHRSSDLLPAVVHESPARMPVTRRPRSLNRDPVFSKFSDLRQQLEILRSIASNVVRREQVKLEDQKLVYESVQQQLLIAREAPRSRRCLWCDHTQSLLNCSSCPKAFCFQCFKHRRGYGVKGWIAASKLPKYVCNFCLGSIAQERGWPELSTTFLEPRGTPASRFALLPRRVGDWNHGLEVRTKSNSGKQVSFLNESSSNLYGSSSSPQEAAYTMAPGRGKMIYTGRPSDLHAVHSNFVVPCTNVSSTAVDRAYHGGVASSGPNDPAGNESRVQFDRPRGESKKVKSRMKVVNTQVEPKTALRATTRIKKLARSSSFVYGSEDETTISENEESSTDKRTVKLSDLRDKEGKSQCTNLLEVGAEDNAEKGYPPLKFGIKFSPTGTLIVRRHGPPQHP